LAAQQARSSALVRPISRYLYSTVANSRLRRRWGISRRRPPRPPTGDPRYRKRPSSRIKMVRRYAPRSRPIQVDQSSG
jgi:hypothetical protein